MQQLILIVLIIVLVSGGYTAGRKATQAQYLEQINANKELYITKLREQRLQYESQRQQLEAEIKDNQRHLADIQQCADNLKLQLESEFNRRSTRMSNTADRSVAPGQCDCGRIRKMETAIKAATDLIQERDRIAQQYNQLRRQCKLN